MKSFGYFLLFLCILGCASRPKSLSPSQRLNYTIEPTEQSNSLKVTVQMQGSKSGVTQLQFAKTWAGSTFTKDYSNLKVLTKGAMLSDGVSPEDHQVVKTIKHRPSEKLIFSYRITQHVGSPDKTYRSLVSKEYFHLIGKSWLVAPLAENDDELFDISMHFKGFPKDYSFANSFFAQKKKHKFQTTIDKFSYGIYVGGDFRVYKVEIKQKPLYLALRGKWNFKDQELRKLAKNIVSYQRNFFDDHDFEQFLITVIPNNRKCCSFGGTGLTLSFATFLPDDSKIGSQLKYLLSHELFHTWNGRRIKRKEPEQLVYWFSEGFTDYYSRLLLLRSRDLSLQDYVDDYNEVLYNYYSSKVINEPNQRILKDFWNDYEVEKLPYRRGNILARKWNAKIKRLTKGKASMDDVLMDLFTEAQAKGTVVSQKSFSRLAGKYVPGGFQKELKAHVDLGKTIVPGKHDLGPCVKLHKKKVGRFEHGYDSQKTYNSGIITGLRKDSPAFKAGARNGQRLLDRKIHFPPVKPSWLQILDGKNRKRKLVFNPVTEQKFVSYHYVVDNKAWQKNPDHCLKWFQD